MNIAVTLHAVDISSDIPAVAGYHGRRNQARAYVISLMRTYVYTWGGSGRGEGGEEDTPMQYFIFKNMFTSASSPETVWSVGRARCGSVSVAARTVTRPSPVRFQAVSESMTDGQ